MPWKRKPLKHFESIPEIAPTGALIKVAYASAYLKSGVLPTQMPSSPWRGAGGHGALVRSSSLGSDGDQSPPQLQQGQQQQQQQVIQPEMIVAGMLFKKRKRSRIQKDAYDSSSYGDLDRHFHHRFEVAGRVQILGEDVDDEEDEDAIREGDQVIVLPFPGQQIGYGDTVCVPNLSYLVKLPKEFPLAEEAVSVLAGARVVLSMVKLLTQVISSKSNSSSPKVLVVGERSLLLWFMHLVPLAFPDDIGDQEGQEENILRPHVTIATDSESLIKEEKNHSQVQLVHWNEDAYQAVLVERTKDACEGEADIVLGLDASTKALRTAIACSTNDCPVLMSCESLSSFPPYARRSLEKRTVLTVATTDESANRDNCGELISLVTRGMVSLPSLSSFAPSDGSRIRKLDQTGQLNGVPVVNFTMGGEDIK